MELKLDETRPFNLDHTLSCGQVFRWEKIDRWWEGVVEGNVIRITQERDRLLFRTNHSAEDCAEFLKNYLRLDDDLPMILSSIDKDSWVNSAIQKFHGLRLIRQNPWECLISYICATNTNIPAIKNRILELSKRFGDEVTFEDKVFYTFPEPQELAEADLDELKSCGLGYRAKYVLKTAKKIKASPDLLKAFKSLEYEELRRGLLSLAGVGPKVADCITLFAFDKLEAFPIDVWVRRVMYQRYLKKEIPQYPKTGRAKPLTGSEYDELRSFAWRYFGKYAGYAQQYLFYHIRIEESRRMSG